MSKWTTPEAARCVANLRQFRALLDQILPQAGKLVLDIGLTNDALMEANQIIREHEQAAEKEAAEAAAWVYCSERLPTAEDADEHGNVWWERSGVQCIGSVAGGRPVDATRWKRTW